MARTLAGARRGGAAAVVFVAALALLSSAHASPPGKDASTSGYIKVPNTKDVHIFYWAFESRGNPDSDPLVLARAPPGRAPSPDGAAWRRRRRRATALRVPQRARRAASRVRRRLRLRRRDPDLP